MQVEENKKVSQDLKVPALQERFETRDKDVWKAIEMKDSTLSMVVRRSCEVRQCSEILNSFDHILDVMHRRFRDWIMESSDSAPKSFELKKMPPSDFDSCKM